jgi:DNA-binding phage protein
MNRFLKMRKGVEAMVSGDMEIAKTILRDYINATVGFTELAAATNIPSKSLMRMLGPSGNPRADNLFEVAPAPAARRCPVRGKNRAGIGTAAKH